MGSGVGVSAPDGVPVGVPVPVSVGVPVPVSVAAGVAAGVPGGEGVEELLSGSPQHRPCALSYVLPGRQPTSWKESSDGRGSVCVCVGVCVGGWVGGKCK